VLQYVDLTNLFAAKCHRMILPRDADVLAEFNETPALALVRRNGSVFLLAGFDVLQSNWPFETSFVFLATTPPAFGNGTAGGQEMNQGLFTLLSGLDGQITAQIDVPGSSRNRSALRFLALLALGRHVPLSIGDSRTDFAVNLLVRRKATYFCGDRPGSAGTGRRAWPAGQIFRWHVSGLAQPLCRVVIYNYKVRI
jgi:hypothetical protein